MAASQGQVLAEKVALITGAATGIGRASALLFARAGARVALSDTRAAELEQTVADVRGAGGQVTSAAVDLARPENCAAAVEAAVRTFGRLDVVLNNAGVGTMVVGGTVETITLEHWDLAQDVNVRAMYLVSRAALPHMRTAGGGAIVSSAAAPALGGPPARPPRACAAAKGGALAPARAMAASYGGDRIGL